MGEACGATVPGCQELSRTLGTVEHARLFFVAGAGVAAILATAVYHAGTAVRWVRYRRQVSRTIAEVESLLAAAARRRLS